MVALKIAAKVSLTISVTSIVNIAIINRKKKSTQTEKVLKRRYQELLFIADLPLSSSHALWPRSADIPELVESVRSVSDKTRISIRARHIPGAGDVPDR